MRLGYLIVGLARRRRNGIRGTAQSNQFRQCVCLVAADELRLADHIGHHDRGEAALRIHSGSPARRRPLGVELQACIEGNCRPENWGSL